MKLRKIDLACSVIERSEIGHRMSVLIENTNWTRNGNTIRDKGHYSTSIGKLFAKEMYSDIVLISEEGKRFPAHRALLAARTDYFSKLLYGGLKETTENEVRIMCSEKILVTVLRFLYSGEVYIGTSLGLDYLMNLLNEVRLMCIPNLQAALEDLIIHEFINTGYGVTPKNVIKILNVAVEKDFPKITKAATIFLEKQIEDILKNPDLLNNLSALGLKTVISGNDLCLPEIEIFRGIVIWMEDKINSEENLIKAKEKGAILSEIRLDQMTIKQLTSEVWPSGLFTDAEILTVLKKQQENKPSSSRKIFLNQNICLTSMGAKVIKAIKAEKSDVNVVLDGKASADDYDCRRGYAMQTLGERLEIDLPLNQKINKIKILLYDRDSPKLKYESYGSYYNKYDYEREVHRDYSYRVESSVDKVKWEVVADFSDYKGRSWQTIYFPEKRMKYIGIVGIREYRDYVHDHDSTPKNSIHVVSIEAILDTNTEDKDRINSGMVKNA